MNRVIQVSAPGSLMLMGEHAVLHGRRALVCALDRRLRVVVQPRRDNRVRLFSRLGRMDLRLDQLRVAQPFEYVLAVLLRYRDRLKTGLDLRVVSELPPTQGLGSSAAVTVAACAALERATGGRPSRRALLLTARDIIRSVQGLGSGADAAASVYGGVVAYRANPLRVIPLAPGLPLVALYAGYKTPTAEVVRRVAAARRRHPALHEALYDLMDSLCGRAIPSIRRGDWKKVGEWMNANQGLLDALGVNDRKLSELVYALRNEPGLFGAKISGSGLGDCAIGLGRSGRRRWPGARLPVSVSAQGVSHDPS